MSKLKRKRKYCGETTKKMKERRKGGIIRRGLAQKMNSGSYGMAKRQSAVSNQWRGEKKYREMKLGVNRRRISAAAMKSNIGAMISEKRNISIKAAKSALAKTKRQKLGEANVAAVGCYAVNSVEASWRRRRDAGVARKNRHQVSTCANRASTISQHRAARYFGTRQSAAI
jgi:hypothetical protein